MLVRSGNDSRYKFKNRMRVQDVAQNQDRVVLMANISRNKNMRGWGS